ncbi:haloacid dehalogenase superfamily protein, subfamily IA, variant 3 with third motif having DD or ED [Spongiibacter sp. IMCC21906]|uniref:GMP/IMP nucleotidase n=1 Tax=Spongiibacter sp. IMCC21906 TaxID=1620392 RepID=UPI00062DFE48|nr:GMP/IMP nucleotidase [Spongiibacter sp. IMCC21906]AKH68278.1 haloacid dehalogenase superfamily protein, subfamily IA, variant 3 with third motif having DD or ED [Spongiibacter sp. IMCC21906]
MINWQDIDTVLLDMDGTLLDLHFDNFFWTQHLPKRYTDIHGGDLEDITQTLIDRIMSERGSLNWYCLDYWSSELKLDITALKEEIAHLVRPFPSTAGFLSALHHSHCDTWLVTNAHRGGLNIKLRQTDLQKWMTHIVSSHDLAAPKEDPKFWERLQKMQSFDPDRSLLIDDTATVLDAAAKFGIRHLLTLTQPDSSQTIRDTSTLSYPAIHGFDEILPIMSRKVS